MEKKMHPIKKIFEYAFFGILVLYFPCVLFVSALIPTGGGFMPSSYLLNLLTNLLLSLPALVSLSSLFLFSRTWAKNPRTAKAIISLTVGIILVAIQLVSYVHISKLLPLSVWSAILQLAFWSVHAIIALVKGRHPNLPKSLKSPIFWLCIVLTFATVVASGLGIKALFSAFPQLSGAKEDIGYEIKCEGNTVKSHRGEHIVLTVTLKNNTGKTYSYEGSYSELKPEIVLVSENGMFKIEHDDMPFTNDYARHTFNHGDTRTTLFYFTIPENAPKGNYSAEMRFQDSRAEQAEVVTVK